MILSENRDPLFGIMLPSQKSFRRHQRAAAGAELRLVLLHAGGDLVDVRDLRGAELEGVAGAHPRLLFGVGVTRGRHREDRDGEGDREADLANGVETAGHGILLKELTGLPVALSWRQGP